MKGEQIPVPDVAGQHGDAVGQPAGIRAQIEDDGLVPGVQDGPYHGGSDESGTAGNEDPHGTRR